MRGFILLLVAWCVVPAWGQEFNCGFFEPEGFGATGAVGTIASDSGYWRGTVRPLILFGKFRGAADASLTGLEDREGVKNQSMANFLDADHKGSLTNYFKEMSYGSLTLSPPADGIQLKRVGSNARDARLVMDGDPTTSWAPDPADGLEISMNNPMELPP